MKRRGRAGKIQPVEVLLRQAMPSQYDVWKKLEEARLEWESVTGPVLGRQSAPLELTGGELVVIAETPLVGSRLNMIGGNIIRNLAARWGLEITKVKVVVGRLPLKSSARSGAYAAPRASHLRVREEDVKEFESRCVSSAPDFPRDAAASLARLRAFFIKRFGG